MHLVIKILLSTVKDTGSNIYCDRGNILKTVLDRNGSDTLVWPI